MKYKEKFDKTFSQFRSFLNGNHSEENNQLIQKLETYQKLFHQMIEVDGEIGRTKDGGYFKVLSEHNVKLAGLISELTNITKINSRNKINSSIVRLYVILIFLSIVTIFVLYRISNRIVVSISSLEEHISKLGNGELPEKVEVKYNDEIGRMKKSINVLTENLENTRDFAISVGEGNFEKEINVFDNKGDLGTCLVEMRKSLLKVSEERELQKQIDDQRMWSNEGLALFSDLIRKDIGDLNEMSYALISNLVKYVGANQGSVFLVNSDIEEHPYLDLMATYAFERKKYADKKIEIGEGMVGTCAIEKETIYLTDIPKGYITITSGLGGAAPSALLIVPLKIEDKLVGVIEIASFEIFSDYKIKFVEKVAESIASHISNIQINIRTNELLKQTKIQAQELAEKEEEMRQNMEELKVTQETMAQRESELLKEIEQLKNRN